MLSTYDLFFTRYKELADDVYTPIEDWRVRFSAYTVDEDESDELAAKVKAYCKKLFLNAQPAGHEINEFCCLRNTGFHSDFLEVVELDPEEETGIRGSLTVRNLLEDTTHKHAIY